MQKPESFLSQDADAYNDSPSNRTLSGDARAPIANLHASTIAQQSVNRGKRPRVADMESNEHRASKSPRLVRAQSTELMPPPPLPFRRPPEPSSTTNMNGTTRYGASPLPPAIQTPRQRVRGESNAFKQYEPEQHHVQSFSSPRRKPSRDQWLHGHYQPQRDLQDEPTHNLAPFQAFNDSSSRQLTSRHFQQPQLISTPHPVRSPALSRFAGDTISGLRGGDTSRHPTSNFPDLDPYVHNQTPRGPQQRTSPVIRRTGEGPWSSTHRQIHQLPTTPSPRKQMMARHTSVASPFFRRSGVPQHISRVTLPHRSERPQVSPRNHNYLPSPTSHQFKRLYTAAPYTSRFQPDQDHYGPAPTQGNNLFTRQINPLPPATPSMRSSFQSGYPQALNNGIPDSRHVSQFNQPNNARLSSAGLGPPIRTVLSNSGHRSGASKASNEWHREQRSEADVPSQQPDMHVGHFLDAGRGGTGASAVQRQLSMRSVRR